MSICLTPARAAASRRNGAQSRGPRTEGGKARSAKNALKHGLCANKYLVADEDAQAFAALEAAIVEELAPQGVLERILAGRIVRAAWRLERAERIEAELFAREMQSPFGGRDSDLGLALIRDCNGARAFDTLLRYRGGALAELFRALRMLKALQHEADAIIVPEQVGGDAEPATAELPGAQRNEPEARRNPRRIEPARLLPAGTAPGLQISDRPIESGLRPPEAST